MDCNSKDVVEVVPTRMIQKVLVTAEDMAKGVGVVTQKRAGGEYELHLVNASHFKGAIVVDTYENLIDNKLINPKHLGDTKIAFVIDKGVYYQYDTQKQEWIIINTSMPIVESAGHLSKNPTGGNYTILTDKDTGGIFIYDEDYKDTNNGGTIIDGWVRQYTGSANVKWFGAIGDGVNDDTEAIVKALASCQDVIFPEGTYKISKTIKVPSFRTIRGAGAIIYSDSDIVMLKLSTNNTIKDIQIKGIQTKPSQVCVSIDGGDSQAECDNSTIDNVTFTQTGGMAIKVTGSGNTNHIVTNCKFIQNSFGVSVQSTGSGINIDNCIFNNNTNGIQIKGVRVAVSNSTFISNTNGVILSEGQSSVDSAVLFSNCIFNNNSTNDLVASIYQSQAVQFDNCRFSKSIILTQTDKFYFFNCVVNGASITFNDSNYSLFKGCNFIKTNIINDGQGSKTLNFFVDCIADNQGTQTSCKNGGIFSIYRTQNLSITAEQQIKVVPFSNDQAIIKMPFHDSFNKVTIYDSVNSCFDFTQISNPAGDDLITARFGFIAQSLNAYYINFGLYKVDSNSETPTITSLDFRKLFTLTPIIYEAVIDGSKYVVFSGTTKIPRGKYKVVYINNNQSGTLLANGHMIQNTFCFNGIEFWGI